MCMNVTWSWLVFSGVLNSGSDNINKKGKNKHSIY